MTTKLTIANGALRMLKEGSLTQSELTNNSREPARLFNAAWDDGGLNGALESGLWRFAKRTAMVDSSPSIEPDFGYRYAFDKPSDFVRIIGMWSNETMTSPLRGYREEAGYWFSDTDPIYVSYVSNDSAYGGDYSLWPQSFVKFCQAHFAAEIARPLTSSGKEAHVARKFYLTAALANDAMADPQRSTPVGSWARARRGSGSSWPDGQPR